MTLFQELGLIFFAAGMLALWLWVKEEERKKDTDDE